MTITKINISIVILIVFASLSMIINITKKQTQTYTLTDSLEKMYAKNETRNVEIPFIKGPFN